MRAVMQRVSSARLSVGGKTVSEICRGLVVYLGVEKGDAEGDAEAVAKKAANLRVFESEDGKMNLSPSAAGGEILLVSQFTLLGDIRKGNRPSFTDAEIPARAEELYLLCARRIGESGLTVKTGVFGADMQILQNNDGPVTVLYDTRI